MLMLKRVLERLSISSGKREERKAARQEKIHAEYLRKITRHDTRKERRQKMKHSFERNNVQMKVRDDHLMVVEEEYYDELTDLYEGLLMIPRKPFSELQLKNVDSTAETTMTTITATETTETEPETTTDTVPNCCIICLDSYKVGDTVVWSCNEECQHAFHRSCIIKYLDKKQKRVGSTPCPCCRRTFTDLEVEPRRKKLLSMFSSRDIYRIINSLFPPRP